ncbi:hypothetical protein TTHERM_000031688 (macronuclear) [Tetrahymena thermophila SB210]|uniref:Uncharacterized protein n=1 Tax=Tetrahymena thermophila (strain SB210) TaxID=312017 RepID=W7X656_TETTS|nr:hypothetical protein TTHERM_000031688 [Tetrahymena thermophila SB210]EWS74855.1 hypothetical protein TTHERM_000031688 [Tetrahymena thermophila SB210]|eukprot:XP_012652568.1 hypothetical protein TTHERM_000031688 [Tetrahymena thermophila SB210]
MLFKSKLTKREAMMAKDYEQQQKLMTKRLESETVHYIKEFYKLLNTSYERIQEWQQIQLQESNCLEMSEQINEMKKNIKQFNKQRKNNRDINYHLSNKIINAEIHFELTHTLNLLTSITYKCKTLTQVLMEKIQNNNKEQNYLDVSTNQNQQQSLEEKSIQSQFFQPLCATGLLTYQVLKAIKIIIKNNQIISLSMNQQEEFIDNLLLIMLLWNGWKGKIEKKIFKNSVIVIESCLVSKRFAFNASILKNINLFIEKIQLKEMSLFLRVLALLVLEVNDKQSYKNISKGGGMNYTNNYLLMNHSLLVKQPIFLSKVFEIAESMIKVLQCLMQCESEIQLHRTVQMLNKSKYLEQSGICISKLVEKLNRKCQQQSNVLLNKKSIIQYCLQNSSLMELLFILQNLLSGSKKIIVQQQLNELDFIEKILTPFYDIFFHQEFNLDQIVCEDDEDTEDVCFTARIQLLRIIIQFIQRDEDNTNIISKFISTTEHFYLQNVEIPLLLHLHHNSQSAINGQENKNKSQEVDGILKYRNLFLETNGKDILENEDYLQQIKSEEMKKKIQDLQYPSQISEKTIVQCRKDRLSYIEDKGLMHKIIESFKSVNQNCQLRFWLGSCLEIFLKGSNWYHQVFVFETSLLYTLIRQYILNQLSTTNNIQITLDVLGELVKFNHLNVIYLNLILNQEGWITKIEQKMFSNIVDTNVFLRNLYLTYEYAEFQKISIFKKGIIQMNKNENLFRILCESNNFRTLVELIKSVNEDNLNQENLCCINSALVILIFSYQKGHFKQILEQIFKYFKGQQTLSLFFQVINVWQNYHQVKTKELYNLEHSTNIPIHYFKIIIQQFNNFYQQNLIN